MYTNSIPLTEKSKREMRHSLLYSIGMRILAIFYIVSLVTGCATQLTENEAASCAGDEECLVATLEKKIEDKKFEREYSEGQDAANYELCQRIYRQHSVPMVHVGHAHGKRNRIDAWHIKDDLMYNRCRALIGSEAWAK